jgi:hypothetical protein
MTRYLVTTRVDGDPRRTQDHAIVARSAWHAGWLFRQLYNGNRQPVSIRPAPQGR